MRILKAQVPFSPTPFEGEGLPEGFVPRAPLLAMEGLRYKGVMERLAPGAIRLALTAEAELTLEDGEDLEPFPYRAFLEEPVYVFDEEDPSLEEELVGEEDSLVYILPGKELDISLIAALAIRSELPLRVVRSEMLDEDRTEENSENN